MGMIGKKWGYQARNGNTRQDIVITGKIGEIGKKRGYQARYKYTQLDSIGQMWGNRPDMWIGYKAKYGDTGQDMGTKGKTKDMGISGKIWA